MKRTVVISVNENPKYSYYIPLLVWAWKRYGWDVLILHTQEIRSYSFEATYQYISGIDGIQSDTLAQVSRLYAACFIREGIIMTSDADMIPLSNYWNPKEGEITCYGRDLTDYHFPMCYVAMDARQWRDLIGIDLIYEHDRFEHNNFYIKKELTNRKDANSNNNVERWVTDQNILTERLNDYGADRLTLIERGNYNNGYPLGRVDRSAWTLTHNQMIDCHAPHDILHNPQSYNKVMELLHRVWPNKDFKWFEDYTTEFKKLL